MIALMPIWAAIKGFVSVNWKWVVIGGVLIFAYFKIGAWYDAYQETKTEERRAVLALALEKQAAEISLQNMAGTMQLLLEHQRKTELLLVDALRRQDEIRTEKKAQVDVFEDHDFPDLVDKKPGLIEKLANKATNERMQELEDALND